MFPEIKEKLKVSGEELTGYLDELKNSKVFKHSKIHIIDHPTPQINGSTRYISNLKIDAGFRFFGDVYLYSIEYFDKSKVFGSILPIPTNLQNSEASDTFMIRGVFDEKYTSDPEKVRKIDRLNKLDQLDI